jgi:hypothetical protein
MLHTEVCRLWSKDLITVYTDSPAMYDHNSNTLTKLGENLKKDDLIRLRLGDPCTTLTWKVVELLYAKSLGVDDLKVGESYFVYNRNEQAVLPYRLMVVDLESKVRSSQSERSFGPSAQHALSFLLLRFIRFALLQVKATQSEYMQVACQLFTRT